MLDVMTVPLAEANAEPVTLMHRVRETLALWHRRIRERDELAQWTERDLRDAGFTTSDVWIEINKPFWRA